MASNIKKAKIKLDLLTNIDMLLIVENDIRGVNMSRYSPICKN